MYLRPKLWPRITHSICIGIALFCDCIGVFSVSSSSSSSSVRMIETNTSTATTGVCWIRGLKYQRLSSVRIYIYIYALCVYVVHRSMMCGQSFALQCERVCFVYKMLWLRSERTNRNNANDINHRIHVRTHFGIDMRVRCAYSIEIVYKYPTKRRTPFRLCSANFWHFSTLDKILDIL